MPDAFRVEASGPQTAMRRSSPTPTIAVVLNLSSPRPGTPRPESIVEAFRQYGAAIDLLCVESGSELVEHARQAVAAGARTIVAAGGDGTVNAVASALVETEAALGILPLGTLNHFAKDLGIPTTWEEAVETVVRGSPRLVDVGEVNGNFFVNNSSVGLYPSLVRKREAGQRLGKRKWSAFYQALLTVLGRYPLIGVTLYDGDQRLSRKTPLVFIGNNDYHVSGLKLGTRDRLDAGRLCVYVTRNVGRWKLMGFAVRGFFGRLRDGVDFDALETTSLTLITGGRRVRVATDGEVARLTTPLQYRIRPQALKVIVPQKIVRAMPETQIEGGAGHS